MPELPEVEIIARNLSREIRGKRVHSLKALFPPILKNAEVPTLQRFKGKEILAVRRRGKMVIIDCEGDLSLLFHLKMTGNFLFCQKNTILDKHTHFIFAFEGQDVELRFSDVRKFGFILCVPTSEASSSEQLKMLGPEPLEIEYPAFLKLFHGRRARIKSLLLKQNFIAGIGNIYAGEILFRAGIHPLTSAALLRKKDKKRLWEEIRDVLREAIEKGGSSIRDYKDAEGDLGDFQKYHRVYGRESLPCLKCEEKIKRLKIGGRSSFFCPRCQSY